MKLSFIRYFVFAVGMALTMNVRADTERFPVLMKLPKQTAQAFTVLSDWQKSFVDLKESEVRSRLGKPDKVKDMAPNSVTGKPMQMLSYRLSRRSEVQFTIHEGEVMAVAMAIVPSANEDGPIDD